MNWLQMFSRTTKRHHHDYVRKGYGGAGWSLYVCQTCGEKGIDA